MELELQEDVNHPRWALRTELRASGRAQGPQPLSSSPDAQLFSQKWLLFFCPGQPGTLEIHLPLRPLGSQVSTTTSREKSILKIK